jgi:hypothetical protein
MSKLLPEIKNTAMGIGAGVGAFVSFFASYQIFHFFCRDWSISTIMAFVLACFVFKLIPTLAISGDTAALAPSAKPYNLTPMYALTEIKDSLGTRYFGDKRWHLDDASNDRYRLFYSCKFGDQEGLGEQIKRKERIVTLEVQVEPLGERVTVRLLYDNVSGEPALSINEFFKDTTAYIDATLKALEAKLQG